MELYDKVIDCNQTDIYCYDQLSLIVLELQRYHEFTNMCTFAVNKEKYLGASRQKLDEIHKRIHIACQNMLVIDSDFEDEYILSPYIIKREYRTKKGSCYS